MEKVIVPDYFEQFSCKCGSCRNPCCDGWGINITEREYFSLIGLACSTKLRHKLDDAFVIRQSATENEFASIRPNYLEQCPMLDSDGLCMLQKEQGESKLPLICRVYPRAVKKYGKIHEICMSCSCEETIEGIMKSKKPFALHETEIDLPFEGLEVYSEDPGKDKIRHDVITIMSDNSLPIVRRIQKIGNLVADPEIEPSSLKSRSEALHSALHLLKILCRESKSIRLSSEKMISYLGEAEGNKLLFKYCIAEKHLYTLLPDTEEIAGRIIANHLLYESFPYTEGCDSTDTAFAAFCTAVTLLKLLCVCGMAESDRIEDFVDILAFASRFIEHSDFYRICSHADHPKGMAVYARFASLLSSSENDISSIAIE